MGTVVYEKDDFQVKRFYGGDKRGVCFAFGGQVELDVEELCDLVAKVSISALEVKYKGNKYFKGEK